jgi:hypothetical protein
MKTPIEGESLSSAEIAVARLTIDCLVGDKVGESARILEAMRPTRDGESE